MTEHLLLINSEEYGSKQLMSILACSLIILLKGDYGNSQSGQLLA